jgi:hypothetical protein
LTVTKIAIFDFCWHFVLTALLGNIFMEFFTAFEVLTESLFFPMKEEQLLCPKIIACSQDLNWNF